jgi:hypothetical protein
MTNKEIEEIKQKLYEIQKTPGNEEQLKRIVAIAKRIGASIPPYLLNNEEIPTRNNINFVTSNIHIVLQTEMMFNACVSAKWSCFFAAFAAIAACISVILTVCLK